MHATFLIIDTNREITTALVHLLSEQSMDYRILSRSHYEDNLTALMPNSILLIDYEFVKKQDFALLRQVASIKNSSKVVLVGKGGSAANAMQAVNMGADEYLMLPLTGPQFVGAVSRIADVDIAELQVPAGAQHADLNKHNINIDVAPVFVAEDMRTKQVLGMAERVAKTDTTVLISGESGTGKEVLARRIHDQSKRSAGPFVAINCAAIPENMLEALLFGYEKGAFTGAHQAHTGKFEQAQGGTLFLDEIGEIDLALQSKLLRVLQEKEVERLCGKKSIPLNIRIIAATNKNLRNAVQQNEFREDLLYRLSVFPMHIPPLRERRGDVLPIAYALLKRHADAPVDMVFSDDAKMKMLQYSWPGNVRELDNVIQRALILSNNDVIDVEDIMFGQHFPTSNSVPVIIGEKEKPLHHGVRQHEQQLIIETLNAVAGSRKEAAIRLGISPRTLRYKLAKLRDAGVEIPGCA